MDGPRDSYRVKSDREGEISCDIPYIWDLKRNQTSDYRTETGSHLGNELMVAGVGGKDGERGSLGWTCTHCYI